MKTSYCRDASLETKNKPCKNSYISPQLLPEEQRPRERLLTRGPAALSDHELLMILLNSGVKGRNVSRMAADLNKYLDSENEIPSVYDIALLNGLGSSKACLVSAMLEYGRRRWGPCGSRISQPSDVYTLIRHYADRQQERFLCISLNGAHEVLAVRIVTIGLVNRTICHPREVFADPLKDRASAVIVAHNHPSGRLEPSAEDVEITTRLRTSSEILGISMLDHLIFSETSYYSFVQAGKLVTD